MIHNNNSTEGKNLHVVIHYDKEKGIKYANGIPFLLEKDIKNFFWGMVKKTEDIMEETRTLRDTIEEDQKEIKKDLQLIKAEIGEIRRDREEFGIIFYARLKESDELRIQRYNEVKEHLDKSQKLIDDSQRFIDENLKYIDKERENFETEEKKRKLMNTLNKIINYLNIGVVINTGLLFIFYFNDITKSVTAGAFLFFYKIVNLTKLRNHQEL